MNRVARSGRGRWFGAGFWEEGPVRDSRNDPGKILRPGRCHCRSEWKITMVMGDGAGGCGRRGDGARWEDGLRARWILSAHLESVFMVLP